MDKNKLDSGQKSQEGAKRRFQRPALIVSVISGIALGALLAFGIFTAVTAWQTAGTVQAITDEQTSQNDQIEQASAHRHIWVPNYATVHHDAVYETVHHDAVYESQTSYHSVCNDCKAVIDGFAADHISDTGHSGYSTNVPITNDVLVQAAYDEPVLVQEAYDETVVDGVTCTSCGDVLSAEQAGAEGIAVPDDGGDAV